MGARSSDLGTLLQFWLRTSGFLKKVKIFKFLIRREFSSSLGLLTNDSALLCYVII